MYPTSSMFLLLAPFMGGNKMATNNKPATTLRCGNVKATIWQNISEKGPFFATTFHGRSKITPALGATAPRLVSMTLKQC